MINQQTYAIIQMLNTPFYFFIFLALSLWSLAWKGFALWKSARNNQRNWFIALLILNSFGILEIIYIFYFSKPKYPKKPETAQNS